MVDDLDLAKGLYIARINDISERLAKRSDYDLLAAAGMLRQLFIDDAPLVHKANSDLRIKLTYYARMPRKPYMPEGSEEGSWFCDIRYADWDEKSMKTVKEQELMSLKCMTLSGTEYTVRDVIKAAANAMGGVHLASSPTEENKKFIEFTKRFNVSGIGMGLKALEGIIVVVLQGLQPLTDAVKEQVEPIRKELEEFYK